MPGVMIRRAGFWTRDLLAGAPVRRHLRDIQALLDGGQDPTHHLHTLLDHARRTVPRYRDLPATGLHHFPVLTKQDLQGAWEDQLSSAFRDPAYHVAATSGSTGTPFRFPQDRDKRHRCMAEFIAFHARHGWPLGARFAYLRSWRPSNQHGPLGRWVRNMVPVDVLGFDRDRALALARRLRRDRRIQVLLGYASSLRAFADHLEASGESLEGHGLRQVFADSDSLSLKERMRLQRRFGCPIHDRYSTEELGLLGMSRPGREGFDLNTASYVFEVLRLDSDTPAPPGELGRVVVTDLFNRHLPLIRYEVGDLAVREGEAGTPVTRLASLQGRAADLLMDPEGRPVSAATLSIAFTPFLDIRRYQVIQTGRDTYRVLAVCPGLARHALALETALHDLLGPTARFRIDEVADIPLQAGGKLRTTLNLHRSARQGRT